MFFINHLTKFSNKIEYTNRNYLLAKNDGKIRPSFLKKGGSTSLTTINDVLYILKTKINLLFLSQLREQRVDIKTISIKMYLY